MELTKENILSRWPKIETHSWFSDSITGRVVDNLVVLIERSYYHNQYHYYVYIEDSSDTSSYGAASISIPINSFEQLEHLMQGLGCI